MTSRGTRDSAAKEKEGDRGWFYFISIFPSLSSQQRSQDTRSRPRWIIAGKPGWTGLCLERWERPWTGPIGPTKGQRRRPTEGEMGKQGPWNPSPEPRIPTKVRQPLALAHHSNLLLTCLAATMSAKNPFANEMPSQPWTEKTARLACSCSALS